MKPSSAKKNVLIIGDSLSIGYTPVVAANLSDIALVQHAPWDTRDGGAEESAYMDQCLEYWTAHPSGIPFVPDVRGVGTQNCARPPHTPNSQPYEHRTN